MTMIEAPRHTLLLLTFLFMLPRVLPGQQKDFQTWWELDLHRDLSGGFELAAELEQRFSNNSLQYDRTLLTVTGNYTLNRYFGLEAGVRAAAVRDLERRMQSRFRAHGDAIGRYEFRGVELSLRMRFQYGFDDIISLGDFRDNNMVNRNRLKLEHHIFGTRITLFGSMESWHLLNGFPSLLTYKMKYSGGLEYGLNFQSRLTIRYILEDEFNVKNPRQLYILLLGYRHDI